MGDNGDTLSRFCAALSRSIFLEGSLGCSFYDFMFFLWSNYCDCFGLSLFDLGLKDPPVWSRVWLCWYCSDPASPVWTFPEKRYEVLA